MDDALAAATSSVDFSFCAEDSSGGQYRYDRGSSGMGTSYESASTSKLVTAVVILRLVDSGYLDLSDHPQDWIDPAVWTLPSTDSLYGMTLAHLLSFTSGFTQEAANGDAYGLLSNQVQAIAAANSGLGNTPGTEFYYGSTHMQVAGFMAIMARDAADASVFSTWNDIFDEFKSETGLFPSSVYDLPFSSNPRLAGGMHWTGEDYLQFLRALTKGEILSPAMMDQLLADRTPSASVTMAYSPPLLAPPNGLGEDWHYGFGSWQECRGSPYEGTPGTRLSCPGAYGAYPFWDRARGFFGIVARQGTQRTYPEGVQIERCVDDALGQWATLVP
jgi:CubicO group peptidase (beta-lactamase class C family)